MSYPDLQELRQGTLPRREDVILQDMFRQIFECVTEIASVSCQRFLMKSVTFHFDG